jgi:hypothetical protein
METPLDSSGVNAAPVATNESNNSTSRQYSVDLTRSILRVPSLASASGSVETHRAGNQQPRVEDSNRIRMLTSSMNDGRIDYSSITAGVGSLKDNSCSGDYSGYSGRMGNGTGPIFVNYRPEEMVSADQQQHRSYSMPSKQMNWGREDHHVPGGHPSRTGTPPTPPVASPVVMRGMPPYSPIRIRSSRGAHRQAAPLGRKSPSLMTDTSSSLSSAPRPHPARTFPVSHRGMGRRPIPPPPPVTSRNHGVDGDQLFFSTGELQMFKKSEMEHESSNRIGSPLTSTNGRTDIEKEPDSLSNSGVPLESLKKRSIIDVGTAHSSSEEEKKVDKE